MQPAASRPRNGGAIRGPEAKKEFENFGEFMCAVRFNPNDQRLVYQDNPAYSEQRMDDASQGGFLVPKQHREEILKIAPTAAVVRPRAQVIPAGSPPDAAITIPALDQGTSSNMYGGVTVSWIGEGQAKPETDAAFREIELAPKEVAGHVVITDKLLRNWRAADSFLTTLFRQAIAAAEDQAFLTGDGSNRPLGAISSANGSRILYNRNTNTTIKFSDVVGMYAKAKHGGNLVWLANQTTLPQLMTLEDGNGNNMWQPSLRDGEPSTLLGLPLIITPRVPALGNAGDLSLVDLQYYLIKDGSGIFVEASPHVYFTSNKTVVKAFWNVDGQPWLLEPIREVDGQDYSPFVVLDA